MTQTSHQSTQLSSPVSKTEKLIEEAWRTHYTNIVLWIETRLRYQTDFAFDAEDVASESFATVVRVLVKADSRDIQPHSISALLWKVVSRRYIDFLRRMNVKRRLVPTVPLSDDVPSRKSEGTAIIQHLLESIQSQQLKQLLQLRYEGNTVPEVAEKLDVSQRTAKRLLCTLRRIVNDIEHDEGNCSVLSDTGQG